MKKNIVSKVLLMVFIVIGIVLLFFGIKSTYDKNQISKNYVSIKGELIGSRIYSIDDNQTTYTLTYSYVVNKIRYTISTDYGVGYVPKMGTPKTIKYNPADPSEAVISGFGSNDLLLFLGIMFTIIPLIITLSNFVNQKLKNIMIGCAFVIFGGSIYYILCLGESSLSILDAFKNSGWWLIIPLLFIIIGIYMIVISILGKNMTTKKSHRYNEMLKKANNILNPIFQIIVSLIFISTCSWILVKEVDTFTKVVIAVFLICGIVILIKSIIYLTQNLINYKTTSKKEFLSNALIKIQMITSHLYLIIFLIFWFGFLIFFDYQAIKGINDGGLPLLLVSLLFWVAGIYFAYRNFKKY